MAVKTGMICFELEELNGLRYMPEYDFDFFQVPSAEPKLDEYIQPIVEKSFFLIKECLARTVEATYRVGRTYLHNVNNWLHIGTSAYSASLHNDSNSVSSMGGLSNVVVVKFHRIESVEPYYKIMVEIEEMYSGDFINPDSARAFGRGINNKDVANLAKLLNVEFNLQWKLEVMPLLRRGRNYNRYLTASDDRVLEYDFDDILFHEQSEFQDVKIVHSPSLGNVLLLDGLQNVCEIDNPYTLTLMDHGNVSYEGKEILILGGGDGALLWELLKEKPKFVTVAEIDPIVITACRQHMKPFGEVLENLEDPRYKIIVEDCIKVMQDSIKEGKKYDAIFNDLTDIPVGPNVEKLTKFELNRRSVTNPWHFLEKIFDLSLDCLANDGFIMTHATGAGNLTAIKEYHKFLKRCKCKLEWQSRKSLVPSFLEIWTFYTIKRKSTKIDMIVTPDPTKSDPTLVIEAPKTPEAPETPETTQIDNKC